MRIQTRLKLVGENFLSMYMRNEYKYKIYLFTDNIDPPMKTKGNFLAGKDHEFCVTWHPKAADVFIGRNIFTASLTLILCSALGPLDS